MNENYKTVIGLEIHVQLNTLSKAFSSDANAFGEEANTNISAVSLGLPGTLPMPNVQHIQSAIKLGLAINSEINRTTIFDRKHYVYPDLPKAYQITQDEAPICLGGQVHFLHNNQWESISIDHIHMEEDAGKSIHDQSEHTLLDYNRAGTPLLEVVTQPDFRSAEQVADFIAGFQSLIRFVGISDANMQEGSLRVDCNVSVRKKGDEKLGTRTEIKNLNSKKFARDAILYEANRHIQIIENGDTVQQESRLYDPNTSMTFPLRKKEDAMDYRYFNDPDLAPIDISEAQIYEISKGIERLPYVVFQQMVNDYKLDHSTSAEISHKLPWCNLFYDLVEYKLDIKLISGFVVNHGSKIPQSKEHKTDHRLIIKLSELLQLIQNGKIHATNAYNHILPLLIQDFNLDIEKMAKESHLWIEAIDDSTIDICASIIKENPQKCRAYIDGKKSLMGFFMGQFMRQSEVSVQPKDIQRIFEDMLSQWHDKS